MNTHTQQEMNFVLLPGLDGTGILAQPFVDQFSDKKNTEVITYPSDVDNSLGNLAKLTEQKVANKQNCIFIAESFGGLVLLEILRRNKLNPKGIIFLATFGESPKPKLLTIIKKLPIDYFPWALVPSLFVKLFAVGMDATDQQIQLLKYAIRSVSPKLLASRLRIIADNPMKDIKNSWTTPCLYIQATNDRLVPDRCANWFKKRFTDFTIKPIEGGHFLLHTRIPQCIEAVEDFKKHLTNHNEKQLKQISFVTGKWQYTGQ